MQRPIQALGRTSGRTFWIVALFVVFVAAALGGAWAMVERADAAPVQSVAGQSTRPAISAPLAPAPTDVRPLVLVTPAAPTSAVGYAALWATLDVDEWGGADVSLSVPLADGRVVWLYGDTLSRAHGMVHSSGITQDGGALHVSRGGAQLLPNNGRTVHWVEAAREVRPGVLTVTAAPIRFGDSERAWDFHRARERSRVAEVLVDSAGDLTFTRWTGTTESPAAFTDLTIKADGHVTYEARAHRWAELEGGATLRTVNNNWTRGFRLTSSGAIDYAAYRPTFYAG